MPPSPLQKSLRIYSRHASHAGGSNRLTVIRVCNIACGKDARHVRKSSLFQYYVPFFIKVNLSFKYLCIRCMTYGYEYTVAWDIRHNAALHIFKPDPCNMSYFHAKYILYN